MAEKKKTFDTSKYFPVFVTIVFIVILFQYRFPSLESIFYDFNIRNDFGIEFKDNIVLITLDGESDEFLGEKYPYTYASHIRLFEKILPDRPKIINYFISFYEPDSALKKRNIAKFKQKLKKFTESGGVFRFGSEQGEWGEHLPPRELREFGYSLAMIPVEAKTFAKDSVSRRMVLNISGENSLHLWTANQYRRFLNKSELDDNSISGSHYVREDDATFGLFRYYVSPLETKHMIKRIPFHRVVVGNFPKGFFTDKIVLIGSNYIFKPDYVLTPFDTEKEKSSKLTVHAEIIESLIQNKTIYQIPLEVSYALSVIIAVFLSLIVSRISPAGGLLTTVIILVGTLLLSYLLFATFGIWLYITHIILTIFAVYYIWVPFRAIIEYQRRYAIQEEAAILKKVEKLKQNFISLMSHDLKTPVAKIAGVADVMLQKYNGIVELRQELGGIVDATRELNNFITSILDLTKVESSSVDLKIAPKDINPLIESVIQGLQYEAEAKKIRVQFEQSPLFPIAMDINLIRRVISNLLENAIKYSGAGSEVVIKTWDDEKWVYVEIRDNGVGIPNEDIDHVFEKFYRVKNDTSFKVKGSGLGLYLVKYFVELHGGKITLQSTESEGTTFLVKLKNK